MYVQWTRVTIGSGGSGGSWNSKYNGSISGSGSQTRIPSDTQVTNSESSNIVTAVSLTVVIPIAAPQNYLVSTDLDWLNSGLKSSSSIVPLRRFSLIFPITARRINEAAHTVCIY